MVNKFKELEDEMRGYLKERDDEIRGLILSVLSKEHLFLVGPPGTAKSMMIRMLHDTVKGSEYFDYLMTRFSKPEEVFGPMKVSQIKQDKYERKIDGYLPDAHFAFIDEIWKANSSILNSLLSVLNERIFDNGPKKLDIPLETCMSASNELPEEREELGAMWDRFLLKYRVRYIQDDNALEDMAREDGIPSLSKTLTLDEIHQAQEDVANTDVPDEVYKDLVSVRRHLFDRGIKPSDRRVKNSMKIVKANAYLHDRRVANKDDLSVLNHIFWDAIEDIPKVREVVLEITNPERAEVEEIYDGVMQKWKEYKNTPEDERGDMASEASYQIKEAIEDMQKHRENLKAQNRDTDKVEKYIKKSNDVRKEIVQENFEVDMDFDV